MSGEEGVGYIREGVDLSGEEGVEYIREGVDLSGEEGGGSILERGSRLECRGRSGVY